MIDVRRGGERFETTTDWLTSRHSFSFGQHYDPDNVGHAVLVAHNDDVVAPGHGYDLHPHADLEIVTWVLAGSLVHEDSHGHSGVLTPGVVQRLSAGSGVQHSERNDAPGAAEPTRFVQMWVRPDESGLTPSVRAVAGRRTGADGARLRHPRPRRGRPDPHLRGGAARRAARSGGVGGAAGRPAAARLRRARGRSTWKAPAGWRRATPPGSPPKEGRG